ncbi:hypothetical protein IFM89_031756 [Coptis chinensis]|uniref:Uncharacterized protein n=1 Tax=Coptis chinensis TaxID=261450 RepID=A0A835LF47_9MAGN|nr:hypothetical protein IFM89_031756 [Coptis chinensis]
MAFRSGSVVVAHEAVNAIMGPHTIQTETMTVKCLHSENGDRDDLGDLTEKKPSLNSISVSHMCKDCSSQEKACATIVLHPQNEGKQHVELRAAMFNNVAKIHGSIPYLSVVMMKKFEDCGQVLFATKSMEAGTAFLLTKAIAIVGSHSSGTTTLQFSNGLEVMNQPMDDKEDVTEGKPEKDGIETVS